MQNNSINPRKCANKACRSKFIPERPFQTWCSPECGEVIAKAKIARANALRAKKDRKEHKDAKERIKTRGDHAKEAQAAFNNYIRQRDKELPCISCGRFHAGQYHAGHYRTVGACPELRFNELNVHKQCAPCNNHLHGNIVEYRIRLIEKIGQDAVNWLEGLHESKHYSIEDLKEIKAEYKAKLKALVSRGSD